MYSAILSRLYYSDTQRFINAFIIITIIFLFLHVRTLRSLSLLGHFCNATIINNANVPIIKGHFLNLDRAFCLYFVSKRLGKSHNLLGLHLSFTVGVCAFMFKLSWRLSMVTVIGLPIIMGVSKVYGTYYQVRQTS